LEIVVDVRERERSRRIGDRIRHRREEEPLHKDEDQVYIYVHHRL